MYVNKVMGTFYTEPPLFDIEACYNDSNECSPLLFILSAGLDPMAGLLKFGQDKGVPKSNIHSISLGQGQVRSQNSPMNMAPFFGKTMTL